MGLVHPVSLNICLNMCVCVHMPCVCRSQYNRSEDIRRCQEEKLHSDLKKPPKILATLKCSCDTLQLSNKRVLRYTFPAKVKPQTIEQTLNNMKFTETLDTGEYNWKTILAVMFRKDKTSESYVFRV